MFSVSLIKNETTKLGWQVFPESCRYSGRKSLTARINQKLFRLRKKFLSTGGTTYVNNLYDFCVRSFVDNLDSKIVPFLRKIIKNSKTERFLVLLKFLKKLKAKFILTKKE